MKGRKRGNGKSRRVLWFMLRVSFLMGLFLAPSRAAAQTDTAPAVPVEIQEAAGAEVREPPVGAFPRLYRGLWLGGSFSPLDARTTGNAESGMSPGFGVSAGLSLGFRPWRFFIIQTDPMFSMESFRIFYIPDENNLSGQSSGRRLSLSMVFPLLIRVPLKEERFSSSLAAGLYFILPLGQVPNEGGSYSVRQDLPLGIMAGMDLGYTLGAGELFASLRYARDVVMTVVSSGLQYVQSRVSLSIGYRFGFLRRTGNS